MVSFVARALMSAGKAVPTGIRGLGRGVDGATRSSGAFKGLPESTRIPEGAIGYTRKGGAIQWKYPTPATSKGSGAGSLGRGVAGGVGTVAGKIGAEAAVVAAGLPFLLNRFNQIVDAIGSLEEALAVIAADNSALASRLASLLEANENDIAAALAALSESDRESLGYEFDHNRGFAHISVTADPIKVSVRSKDAKSNRRPSRSELVQLQDRAGINPELEGAGLELLGGAGDILP